MIESVIKWYCILSINLNLYNLHVRISCLTTSLKNLITIIIGTKTKIRVIETKIIRKEEIIVVSQN